MKNTRLFLVAIIISIIATIAFISTQPNTENDLESTEPIKKNQLADISIQIITDTRVVETKSLELLGDVSTDQCNQATLAVIRSHRYGYFTEGLEKIFWQSYTGKLDGAYIDYFEVPESDELLVVVTGMDGFIDPITGGEIDFIHMIAVIDVYLTDFSDEDDGVYEEKYYDYLLSWGGDLETFKMNLVDYVDKNSLTNYKDVYNYAYNNIGGEGASYFSSEDLLADIDGVNIAGIMAAEDMRLSEALELYYTHDYVNRRYELFIDSFGGEEAFEEAVHLFINMDEEAVEDEEFVVFLEDFYEFKSLMMRFKANTLRETTSNENRALEEAFIANIH